MASLSSSVAYFLYKLLTSDWASSFCSGRCKLVIPIFDFQTDANTASTGISSSINNSYMTPNTSANILNV